MSNESEKSDGMGDGICEGSTEVEKMDKKKIRSKEDGNALVAATLKTQRSTSPAGLLDAAKMPGGEVLSWVACDKCEKWRRLTEGSLLQYQDEVFQCSFLPGFDCSTPEETLSAEQEQEQHLGRKSKACIFGLNYPPLVLNKCGYFDIFSVKMQSKLVFCPTCQVGLERGQRGREKKNSVLERHYRVLPVCRPADEVTPATVASLIVDLSDRLPYRAVVRKVNTHTLTFSQLANSLTLSPAFTLPSSFLCRSLPHSLHFPLLSAPLSLWLCPAESADVGKVHSTRKGMHDLSSSSRGSNVAIPPTQTRGAPLNHSKFFESFF